MLKMPIGENNRSIGGSLMFSQEFLTFLAEQEASGAQDPTSVCRQWMSLNGIPEDEELRGWKTNTAIAIIALLYSSGAL